MGTSAAYACQHVEGQDPAIPSNLSVSYAFCLTQELGVLGGAA